MSGIPGFSEEQSWAIEKVIERAVSKGVEAGIGGFQKSNCAIHLNRADEVRRVVLGHNGTPGLDERVNNLERFELRINRLTWMVVAEALVIGVLVVTRALGMG